MADVRAMLRAERASRAPAKAKAPPKPATTALSPSKKRKAGEEDALDARKRARSDTVASGKLRDAPEPHLSPPAEVAEAEPAAASTPTATDSPADEPIAAAQPTALEAIPAPANAQALQPDIDEDEWAAFERDVATPPPETIQRTTAIDALNSTDAISAAPMTAGELAAKAREEQSAQRGNRDVEIEGEKEDAEQALAEEFEEMEALEERVRKLRERRESIRKGRSGDDSEPTVLNVPDDVGDPLPGGIAPVEEEDEDDIDGEDDDWDDWRFRSK